MSSMSHIQDFDAAVEQCSGDIMEFFVKLNGTMTEQTFEETSIMLHKFDGFRAAIENSVRRKTATLLRARNSLATIYKLPIELLQIIFRVALFSSSGRRRRRYVARLTILRSVSWMWRGLIEQTPSFWTQLSSQDHIDFVSEALSKSQSYSLHLKYVGVSGYAETKPSPFLEKAFIHLDRWEHVTIQDPHRVLIEKYFMSPAPRLKRLALSTQMGFMVMFDHRPLPVVFGGEFAALEELRALQWERVDWNNVNCHKLRILQIEGYFWLDMEKLFSIITENPDLRILRLHRIKFRGYTHPPQEPKSHILQYLTDLNITEVSEIIGGDHRREIQDIPAIRLLRRVQVPACTSFSAEIELSDASGITPAEMLSLIPRPSNIFTRRGTPRTSGSTVPTARVNLRSRGFECQVSWKPKLSPSYKLSLSGVPSTVSAEWVRRELVDAWTETTKPHVKLQGSVDGNELKIDHIFDLQDLESVVELDLIGSPVAQRVEGVGQKLETPFTSKSGTLIGPFLGLQTLRLSNCAITGREVLRMVNERFVRIMQPLGIAVQNTTGGTGTSNIPAANGVTIILGAGMDRFSRSMASDIRAAPGVKELRLYSKSQVTDHGASDSSEESDWSPYSLAVSKDTGWTSD